MAAKKVAQISKFLVEKVNKPLGIPAKTTLEQGFYADGFEFQYSGGWGIGSEHTEESKEHMSKGQEGRRMY